MLYDESSLLGVKDKSLDDLSGDDTLFRIEVSWKEEEKRRKRVEKSASGFCYPLLRTSHSSMAE